jgi:TetR/AcrR family transcriptional regulator
MGVAERKERERNRRRNDIIDAAEKVFMTKGFENATMDDVAEEAEFSKGTLYTYFQSKNELCLSIVLRGINVLMSRFDIVKSLESPGLTKLRLLAEACRKFYVDFPNYAFAFSNYKQHRTGCNLESSILDTIDEKNAVVRQLFSSVIESGKTDLSIKTNADSEKLTWILWGDISGVIPSSHFNSANTVSAEYYNYTITLICDAIKK